MLAPRKEKKQEYKLLFTESEKELSKEVSKHLSDGWTLYGSPQIVNSGGSNFGHKFGQAVIRNIT